MISFYILFERFFLKRKGLSDTRVALITKKEYDVTVDILVKIKKVFKDNI